MQEHITGAVSGLEQLDTLASACLTALQQAADTDANAPCTEFLTAIDGETLAQYLAHCAALTEWKETYIAEAFRENQNPADSASALRLLVGADYACGDNALQQRTEFVTTAFAQLQQRSNASGQDNALLDRRLREMQFNSTLSAERRLLQNSVQQQQLQRDQASERQMRQLELELVRQQRLLE